MIINISFNFKRKLNKTNADYTNHNKHTLFVLIFAPTNRFAREI